MVERQSLKISFHGKFCVAEVAMSVLGIPATSVASERLFSKCGLVISDRRSSLSQQHVEQLVFLSQNLP